MPEVDHRMQGYSVLIISMYLRWSNIQPLKFPHVDNQNMALVAADHHISRPSQLIHRLRRVMIS